MTNTSDTTQAERITYLYTAFMQPDKDNDGSQLDTFTVTRIGLEHIAEEVDAYTNKRIEEVLDHLSTATNTYADGEIALFNHEEHIPLSAIEAERQKLREGK